MVFVLVGALATLLPLMGAPAHPHPYLMPPAEKQRLVEHLRSNESARKQFETIKTRAKEGKFADAALAFALEGDPKLSEVVRRHLLQVLRERTKGLDEDIAAGGHREGNMEFYWDTAEIRAYDLVSPALPPLPQMRINHCPVGLVTLPARFLPKLVLRQFASSERRPKPTSPQRRLTLFSSLDAES